MKNGDFFPTRKKQDFSQFRIIAVKKRRRVLNHFFTLKWSNTYDKLRKVQICHSLSLATLIQINFCGVKLVMGK